MAVRRPELAAALRLCVSRLGQVPPRDGPSQKRLPGLFIFNFGFTAKTARFAAVFAAAAKAAVADPRASPFPFPQPLASGRFRGVPRAAPGSCPGSGPSVSRSFERRPAAF